MKLKTAQLREWLDAHYRDEITYGKVVQNINEFFDQPDKPTEWIAVSERLPELPETVLVFRSSGTFHAINTGRFSHEDLFWIVDGIGVTVKVTHWMPLPTPPQKQKP